MLLQLPVKQYFNEGIHSIAAATVSSRAERVSCDSIICPEHDANG